MEWIYVLTEGPRLSSNETNQSGFAIDSDRVHNITSHKRHFVPMFHTWERERKGEEKKRVMIRYYYYSPFHLET